MVLRFGLMADRERDEKLIQSKRELFDGLSRSIRSKRTLRAMEMVPRERFVPPDSRHMAYLDVALSIGEGQTISQPYVVALMIASLRLKPHERVLEVGTGSGYEAAVLAQLVPDGIVVTVELLTVLAVRARDAFNDLGYLNIDIEPAGATLGCPSRGPYNAIVVAAAAPALPESLLAQLAPGGRMVIPVGTLEKQELVHVLRTQEGLSFRMLGPCRFVPLIGDEGFPGPR